MSLVKVLSELTGVQAGEVANVIGGSQHEPLLSERKVRGKLVLPEGLGPLLPVHKRYLRSRGLKPSEMERLWGLSGIGIAPEWPWSIWIPIQRRGETVSWTTRAISNETETGRRYGNAKHKQEALPAKSTLLGLDFVKHAAIVVEGPMDAFKIGPGAVATMGVGYSKDQVALLSKIPVRVICMDNEPNAQARAKDLCRKLESFPGSTLRVMLDSKDAGSAPPKEIRQLRRAFLD